MIKIKVAFLEGRLLSSQSKQSEKLSKSPDWLENSVLRVGIGNIDWQSIKSMALFSTFLLSNIHSSLYLFTIGGDA